MSERLSDFPNRKFSLEIFHFNLISSIQCTIENCPHNTKSHLKSWVFRAQKINNTNWLSRQCIPSPFAKHNVPELHNENSPMINVITGAQLKSIHWVGGFVHSPISSVFSFVFLLTPQITVDHQKTWSDYSQWLEFHSDYSSRSDFASTPNTTLTNNRKHAPNQTESIKL